MIDHIDHPANTTIDEIYVYNQQSWGGGGTTGTSPFGKTPEERFGRACKIGDGIMEEYKGTLISAVDYFATTPLYSDLYGILATRVTKITFQVDPLIGTPARYDGKTNTISFRTVTDIIDYNTNEELVHAAQKVMYGSKMTNDIKNFEFEAKVIQDIVSERLGFRPFRGNWGLSDPFASEYEDFIELLGAKKELTEKDLQVYFELLSDWSNPEYKGDIEFSILPILLILFFNKIFTMKKILLSIVACLSLTGELLAQKTSDFTYFQVVSVLNSGKVVLEPFSSPKRVGPIGNYDSTPENNRGYRLYRMRVKNLLEMYCKSRNWFPKKEWLEKYNLSYTFYFDREMKIFSYKISVNSDVFTEISEKQLKDIGEYFMEELDLHPYFCIAEDKKSSFTWSEVGFSFKILFMPIL